MKTKLLIIAISILSLNSFAQKKGVAASDVDSLAAKIYSSYDDKLNPLVEAFATADSLTQITITKKYNDLSKQCDAEIFNAYASHINNGEYYIEMVYRMRGVVDKEMVKTTYNKIKKRTKEESPYAITLKKFIDTPQITSGDQFVDFDATLPSGEKFVLSEFVAMKDILLIFGASSTDVNTLTLLKMLYSKADYSKIEVVAVSVTAKDTQELQAEVAQGSSQWVNVSDFKGDHSDVKIAYGVQMLPTFVLIRKTGKVEFISIGASQDVFAAFAK